MNKEERKMKINDYLNQKPQMGIIYYKCKATGEYFIEVSQNVKANLNGMTFQLKFGNHANKELQALWNSYGEEKFEYGILQELKYDDKKPEKTDYSKELATLSHKLEAEYSAKKIKTEFV